LAAGYRLFLLLGELAIQVLTLGFGLHLLLRALWVALVCVTYLYPAGAAPESVHWRKPFWTNVPNGSYFYDLLVRLNRACATIMFMAIISTLLLGGLMLLVVILGTFPSLFTTSTQYGWYYWYGQFFLAFLVLYILDLLLFGAFRRTPVLVWLVFPVFWLFDRVSLRVVVQPALWLFVSHVSRWRMAGLLAVFMVGALTYSYAVISKDLHLPNILDRRSYRNALASNPPLVYGTYRDEMNGQPQRGASIPSKFIDKPYLELFVIYHKNYDEDMLAVDSARYLSDLIVVSIDSVVQKKVAWYPTYNQANDQLGITGMVPVKQLKPGFHQLLLTGRVGGSRHLIIPFWKIE